MNLYDTGYEQDCNLKDARQASMCGGLTETVKSRPEVQNGAVELVSYSMHR